MNYELAAHLRDCCDAVTSAFTEKNLLKEGEKAQWRLKQIEWHREKYRKLSVERLLELPAPPEGCEAAIALADVKRERLGSS